MTETTRIRWEPLSSGPLLGYVTPGQWLFQIYKPSDDADSTELALMSYLPGQTGDYRYADDPDELKRAAEDWLARFVSSLGAIFPGSGEVLVRIEEEERPAAFFDEHDLAAIKAAAEPGTTAATAGEDQPCSH